MLNTLEILSRNTLQPGPCDEHQQQQGWRRLRGPSLRMAATLIQKMNPSPTQVKKK